MHQDFRAEIMKARTADAQRRAAEVRLAQAFKQDSPALRDDARRLPLRLRLRRVLRRLAAAFSRAAVDADPAS